MGQIFTWEAIRAGEVPKRESFDIVARQLRATLSVEPAVVSALLFGSVVRGDFNNRSDIDCLVLYKTESEKSAMAAMQSMDRIAHDFHVPINFTPCDTVLAQTRLHHLGVSFVQHLQASIDAGGFIKGNFIELLSPTISAEQEIESYIKMKMYNMQESLAQMTSYSDERLVTFLKKAMEATTHVARKMLIYEGALEGDSKRQVQSRFRETMPANLSSLFDHLLEIDFWYSLQLDEQVKKPDEASYALLIYSIQNELPKVLEFLRLNILRLNAATRQ